MCYIMDLYGRAFEILYVDNLDRIARYIPILEQAELLAIDTETTGLDPLKGAKLRLLQIAMPNTPVLIIDFFKLNNAEKVILGNVLEKSNAVKIFHNAKFDLKFLHVNGIKISNNIFDTMLAELVILSGLAKTGYSLQDVSVKYLKIELDKTNQKSNWTGALSRQQLKYAAMDVYILSGIYVAQKEILESLCLYDTAMLENQVVIPTYKMELHGMYMKNSSVLSLLIDIEEEKAELEAVLQGMLPGVKNLNSPSQVLKALNALGLDVRSTASDILKPHQADYDAVKKLLDYRTINKRCSLFESLQKEINPTTKRIHSNYKQNMTSSGRYSCTAPNLQGIPHQNKFRSCFQASKNNVFIIADYSQIELRIVAEMANDKTMIEAFNNNEDIHKKTAALINGKSLEDVTKEERQSAKAMNFGLVYGMGYNGFQAYAKNGYGVDLSLDEVTGIVDKFFRTYQGLTDRLNELNVRRTLEERTMGNRRRAWKHLPPITERANSGVQGTGADILKRALVLLNDNLLNDDVKLICIVHDEIVLEVPKNQADAISKKLKRLMEEAGAFYIKKVPIIADISIGASWADK